VSRDLVSAVTAKVTKEMRVWQKRPLDPVYPVVIIDAIVMKVRSGTVVNRPVYEAPQVLCRSYTGCGSRSRAA
jgi:putative transposase